MLSRLSRVFRRGEKVGLEDVFMVAHLYALSTAGVERAEALKVLSEEDGVYRASRKVIRWASNLLKGWGYGLARVLSLATRFVKGSYLEDFFIRYAQAISSGVDSYTFLKAELNVIRNIYQENYNRKMEAMKLLLALFTTFISSFVFLIANLALMSMLLGGGDQLFMVSSIAMIAALIALTLIVIVFIPREPIADPQTKTMRKIRLTSLIGIPPGIAVALVLAAAGLDPALAILIGGVPIAVAGRIALRQEIRLLKYDDIFPTFLRSLGHILSTSPNLEIALETILRIPLGILKTPVDRMYKRLKMGVPTYKSWKLFIEDISTYIAKATGAIFYHTFSRFGNIKEVSDYLGMISLNIMDLRRLRIQLAKSYEATVLIIHLLISIVVGLISSLVIMFGEFLSISGYVTIPIAPLSKDIMDVLNYMTLLTASVVNGLTARSTFPGSLYPATWYIGLFIIVGFAAFYGSEAAITRFIGVFTESAEEIVNIPTG